ncbi:TPA: DUF3289 family protein [Serratia rubidaea]|uniref:YPO3983 family protein n=1 Tax=Serratia rubidaea TaxID=61652 RepID=UPI0023B10B27|nr:YPO3983 family protein [Serratia rubidaea]MDK1706257.1 DUF3289 family protein [Serratia rubidaea]HDJ1440406.1 DUF3289 family protein [Serratia rubidaea]HDJ1449535.1 DUF3289 family protein [Serratia rubidaea]HDJ1460087.1 DUF3289 family protein [Serratia rubidaea]HDJ2770197.1 DUF3289 family protein [Serratia rubidaea]
MTALQFPCTIFKTKNIMDDYGADDMRCGDLSASQLKTYFHLVDVSTRVNPYTLTPITPFNQPHSRFYGMRGQGTTLTRQECARILFDEFRQLSRLFALYGPYKHLIEEMIGHMQHGNGTPFSSPHLNAALKAQILRDREKENSSRLRLQDAFSRNIDWKDKIFPEKERQKLIDAIVFSKLPKFDRFQDNFNGMGITVHDIWATHITIKSLQVDNEKYCALVHYRVQDHFGLDDADIRKVKFNQFRFFRIWFVLQHYNLFGFKPFMTNMEATVKISGRRDEKN